MMRIVQALGGVCAVLLLLVLLAASDAPPRARAQTPDYQLFTLQHDDAERTYSAFVPETASDNAPVLVGLHVQASSGRAFAAETGLNTLATELGAIALYPDTLTFSWQEGRDAYADRVADSDPRDDEGFLLALLEAAVAEFGANPDDVTLVGMSNGGNMATRLACAHPQRIRRIVIAGSLLPNYIRDNCPPPTPDHAVEVLLFQGGQDLVAAPAGRRLTPPTRTDDGVTFASLNATLAWWIARNGCPAAAAEVAEHTITAGVQLSSTAGLGCAAPVTAVTVADAGHAWLRSGDYALNQYGVDYTDLLRAYLNGGIAALETAIDTLDYNSDVYGGITRTYRTFTPADYDPARPYPLVVALHGRPGNGYGMAYLLDMNDTAAANDVIMVYPDGQFREWHYTNGYEGFGTYSQQDDVEFLGLLLQDLLLDYNIDPAQTFLVGFSNGGYMTQRVACEAPATFDGYAVIGAGMLELLIEDYCAESDPVSIAFIHGTTDPSIPFQGIEQGGFYVSMPIPQTVSFWATKAGCSPDNATDTRVDPVAADNSYVVRYDFTDCSSGQQVQFFMVVGGGHTIPGAPERLSGLGNYNQDIDTGAVLWEFWQ